jgi:DNA adenine methylase
MSAPPMAYYGGKTMLAARIAAALPTHKHYVEPFAGSLAVLLAKQRSFMETVNDLDGDLMNFWRVLRERPDDLARVCALTPHSRTEHFASFVGPSDDCTDLALERARLTWVRISQGRTGTLRKTGWRFYVNPEGSNASMPTYLSGYVDRMAAAAERLHHVSLECRPATELIAAYGQFDSVCLYLDPPYLGATRCRNYRTEMTSEAEHVDMLDLALQSAASVVISGYASDLYDTALADWSRIEIPTSTGQSAVEFSARTEILWVNRDVGEMTLFDETA